MLTDSPRFCLDSHQVAPPDSLLKNFIAFLVLMIQKQINSARKNVTNFNMSVEAFIKKQIPVALLARFPLLLRRGHELARQIIQDNPILRVPSLQRGDIRGAAIDFTVSEFLYSRGREFSQVSYDFPHFAKPTGKYLQVEMPEAVLTISHVVHQFALPRKAAFREHGCKNHQPELFADFELERQRQNAELRALEAVQQKKHLILIYGDQNIEFVRLGAMDATAKQWLETPMDLLASPMVVVDHSDDDAEAKDISIPMEVKAQFIKHLSEDAE